MSIRPYHVGTLFYLCLIGMMPNLQCVLLVTLYLIFFLKIMDFLGISHVENWNYRPLLFSSSLLLNICGCSLIIGREDWFGLYGCGRPKEAKQKQEVGEETCQEVSCLLSFWSCYQANSPSSWPWAQQGRQVCFWLLDIVNLTLIFCCGDASKWYLKLGTLYSTFLLGSAWSACLYI